MSRSLSILACLSLIVPSAAAWEAATSTEGGVSVISNPDTPRDGESVRTATSLWRWGAGDDDPILGRVTDAFVDDDGNTFILDSNLSEVHVVDATGSHVRTIGGEGDGPGEIRNAIWMAPLDDGHLAIAEMLPGGVEMMDLEGNHIGTFKVGPEGALMSMVHGFDVIGDAVVVGHHHSSFGNNKVVSANTLGTYDLKGRPILTLHEEKREMTGGEISMSTGDEQGAFARNFRVAASGDVIVYGKPYDYELVYHGADGKPSRIVRRDYETRAYTQEEQQAQIDRMKEIRGDGFHAEGFEPREFHADITSLHARDDGSLWVETSTSGADEAFKTFDVIDANGHYVNTLRVDGIAFDPERDDFVISGDYVLVFKESRMAATKTTTSGGGGMQMVMVMSGGGGSDDEGEYEEPEPMEVLCYELD